MDSWRATYTATGLSLFWKYLKFKFHDFNNFDNFCKITISLVPFIGYGRGLEASDFHFFYFRLQAIFASDSYSHFPRRESICFPISAIKISNSDFPKKKLPHLLSLQTPDLKVSVCKVKTGWPGVMESFVQKKGFRQASNKNKRVFSSSGLRSSHLRSPPLTTCESRSQRRRLP